MKLTAILRNIAMHVLAPAAATIGLAGCNGLIYDDQGDCDPYYKVRFVYDRNLKFSDAFPAEVHDVTLYVVDKATGTVVWQKHEDGEELRREGYLMDVDVTPGTYTLMAWAGTGHRTSFSVADTDVLKGLRCRLTDRHDPEPGHACAVEGPHVNSDLARLYHGLESDIVFEDKQGTHVKTVHLTKNTNSVHIVLQHLSGENIDHRDFTFTVTDDNGHMDYDNSLIPDGHITYTPHDVSSGTAGVDVPDYAGGSMIGRTVTQVSAAVAHLTTSRMVKGNDMRVKIYNKKGECIVSVPLIDYALLVKGKYKNPSTGALLDDQEYLDRQDDYSMVFFLDENGRWMNSYIYINSWRVILQDADI